MKSIQIKHNINTLRIAFSILSLLANLGLRAQSFKTDSTSIMQTRDSQIRFFGIDYSYTAPQTPHLTNFNMKGVSSSFQTISADIAYAWYLDKKRERTILLPRLLYKNTKHFSSIDENEKNRINNEIPSYLLKTPDIHTFGLSIILNHKIREFWNLTIGTDLVTATDIESFKAKNNINSTNYFVLQRKKNNFELGFGAIMYIIKDKITPYPILNLGYVGTKLNVEITAPVSLDVFYLFNPKTKLGLESKFIMSGYGVDFEGQSSGLAPNYIDSNGFDFSLYFDRQFFEIFHSQLSFGYSYREDSYKQDSRIIHELTYQNGLFFKISFYSAF